MQTREELLRVNAELRERLEEEERQLAELKETMEAIRRGEVDALVTSGPGGERIFTMETAERPYRLMIEEMQQGAGVLEPGTGTILYSNHSLAMILEIPQQEVPGKSLFAYVAPADLETFKALLQSSAAGKADGELELVSARGRTVPADLSLVAMPGDLSTVSLVVTDLRERRYIEKLKASEAALRQLTAQLSAEDRRKNEFLATLAHELRNPLAPINSGLELMKIAGAEPALMEETRLIMERQMRQLVTLVDDLLNVSRVTRGKVELRRRRVDMREVVRNAIESSRPAIDQAGHDLRVESPATPVYVDGDLIRLAQVFSNLLNNAAKYTPNGGSILFTYRQEGSEVVAAVKDSGIGIPGDMLESIFGMFTQVGTHKARGIAGLGIGLTLVKSLVELHGGSVRAASAGEEKGSEFTVRLPAAPEQQADADEKPRRASREAGRLHILIVDDNRDAANTLSMLSRILGHEVKVAHDGREAVAMAGRFLPDLVLMDIGMPVMDGYEAARSIRSEDWGEDMVLVALTGWGQEEDRKKAKAAGFDEHLVKPVNNETFEELLARQSKERGTGASPVPSSPGEG